MLEYGNMIWSPRLIRDIDAVERVQSNKDCAWHQYNDIP